jgi:[acyl-carrier-protein] S-malonyltransferase
MKTAILFSGQGTQYVNMGIDFIESIPSLNKRLELYSQLLDLDILAALKDETKINDTRYTQPLMVVVEMLIHDYLVSLGLKVDGYTGFSLGEFSALYAAGFYDEATILKIIDMRAKLMQESSKNYPGSMAAILGLSDDVVEDICKQVSNLDEFVVPANYNSDGQLVISGSKETVTKAAELAKSNGARRAMILNVSGAFHSPYMNDAGNSLKLYVENFKINEPSSVLYANTTGRPLSKVDVIDEIYEQISNPVYFKQTIKQMVQDGFERFIEVGPGQVLSGLVKKVSPESSIYSVSKFEDIKNIEEILK